MVRLVFTLFIFLLLTGCDLRLRESELEKRESEIKEREQKLILKEKELVLREDALNRRTVNDSTRVDSTHIIPGLTGNWNVKMTCTETTCSGSAVGDTKSENWSLSYQGNSIIARAMEGDKLVRVYTGSFNNSSLILKEDVSQQGTNPAASLTVRLNILGPSSMEGDREIVRQNGCRIIYRMQMNKQ